VDIAARSGHRLNKPRWKNSGARSAENCGSVWYSLMRFTAVDEPNTIGVRA
jgi:hypothetical protein